MIAKFVHAVKLHVAVFDNAPEVRSLMLAHVAAAIANTAESLAASRCGATDARVDNTVLGAEMRTKRCTGWCNNVCCSRGDGSVGIARGYSRVRSWIHRCVVQRNCLRVQKEAVVDRRVNGTEQGPVDGIVESTSIS